jgi:hypothetical protein
LPDAISSCTEPFLASQPVHLTTCTETRQTHDS